MAFLKQEQNDPLITVKLTNIGRKLIANGFKLDNIFDMVKFAFGDSDIDYTQDSSDIENQLIVEPELSAKDFTTKLYHSGIEPSGDANISLTQTALILTTLQTSESIGASTIWPPVEGNYIEQYHWTNLGPMKDYEIQIVTAVNTTSATIKSIGFTGTTKIKVKGATSGKHSIINVTIQ